MIAGEVEADIYSITTVILFLHGSHCLKLGKWSYGYFTVPPASPVIGVRTPCCNPLPPPTSTLISSTLWKEVKRNNR